MEKLHTTLRVHRSGEKLWFVHANELHVGWRDTSGAAAVIVSPL